MIKIILQNTFHRSSCNLRADEDGTSLTIHQVRRARRKLCGVKGCTCGGYLGERGPVYAMKGTNRVRAVIEPLLDGGAQIHF